MKSKLSLLSKTVVQKCPFVNVIPISKYEYKFRWVYIHFKRRVIKSKQIINITKSVREPSSFRLVVLSYMCIQNEINIDWAHSQCP